MRRLGLIFCFAAANLVAAPGCQRHSDYDDAMPETSAYTLELTGDEGSSLTKSSDDVGSAQQALSGQEAVGNTLQRTKDAVEALNAGIHQIMDPLAALVGAPNYAVAGEAHVFEFDHSDVHMRFAIARFLGNRFVWKLDAKPQGGADTAYVRVMTGAFARGEVIRRGRGLIGFDLSAMASVSPSYKGTGQLLVAFAHVAGHKVLRFAAKDYSADVTQHDPVSALFSGWRGPLGGTDVRAAAYANLPDSATSAKELTLMHAQWRADIGGRVDAVAAGGDVPANHAIVAFACYRANQADEGYLRVADCDAAALSCTPIATEGLLTNCIAGMQTDELPNTDPNVAPLPKDAPEDPGIPTVMPSDN